MIRIRCLGRGRGNDGQGCVLTYVVTVLIIWCRGFGMDVVVAQH